jgi:energy-coupling factor transporter ATP-binding protein EcfA2
LEWEKRCSHLEHVLQAEVLRRHRADFKELVIAETQGCGKSSLLENLTGLSVPTAFSVTARFAIEIILINDIAFQIEARIIRHPNAPAEHTLDIEKIERFKRSNIYNSIMTQAQFEYLICEVLFDKHYQDFNKANPIHRRQTYLEFQAQNSQVIQSPMR